jgi:group I intron endonuclease
MLTIFINGKVTADCPNTAGIYYWKNNVNGKGYVGQTQKLRRRISTHKSSSSVAEFAFYSAIRKYGIENFTCYKVMDCCPSKVALDYWETFWIKELDTFGLNGYNCNTGGHSNYRISEMTRRKIGDGNRGKQISDESKEKMRIAAQNRWTVEERRKASITSKNMSIETRRKIGEASRRRIVTEDTRRRMSISGIGKKRPSSRKSCYLRHGTLWKEFFIFPNDSIKSL